MHEFIGKATCIDALALCALIDPHSIDAIIADLPYGITEAKWDVVIPIEPMWKAFNRVLKPKGAIVLTSNQPFASMLVMSNLSQFHQELIWEKDACTGHLDANRKHLRIHETVLVFCDGQPTYNPQKTPGKPYVKTKNERGRVGALYKDFRNTSTDNTSGDRYPLSIIRVGGSADRADRFHPTQKPVELMQYLIRTFTNEGELVLDPTCGSGSTGLAALRTKRRFIIGDNDANYVGISNRRLASPYAKVSNTREESVNDLPLFSNNR